MEVTHEIWAGEIFFLFLAVKDDVGMENISSALGAVSDTLSLGRYYMVFYQTRLGAFRVVWP